MPTNGLRGGVQWEEGDASIVMHAGAMSSALESLSKKERREYSVAKAILGQCESNCDAGLEREVSALIEAKIGRPAKNGGLFIPTKLNPQMASGLDTKTECGRQVHGRDRSARPHRIAEKSHARDSIGCKVSHRLAGEPAIPNPGDSGNAFLDGRRSGFGRLTGRHHLRRSHHDAENLPGDHGLFAPVARAKLRRCGIYGPLGLSDHPCLRHRSCGHRWNRKRKSAARNFEGYWHWVCEHRRFRRRTDRGENHRFGNCDRDRERRRRRDGVLNFARDERQAEKIGKLDSAYASVPLWDQWGDAPGVGDLIGYKALVSNQVPQNLVTLDSSHSDCHAIIFGVWPSLIVGEWGVLEIISDPYSLKKQGLIEVTSFQLVDVMLRHPEQFAAILDARNV